MDDKYCRECGLLLRREKTGRFDPQTGEPEYRGICTREKCGHTGHSHEFTRAFVFGIVPYGLKCSKCGAMPWEF